jgi:hypothetical protein
MPDSLKGWHQSDTGIKIITERERERLTGQILGIQCHPHRLEQLAESESPTILLS